MFQLCIKNDFRKLGYRQKDKKIFTIIEQGCKNVKKGERILYMDKSYEDNYVGNWYEVSMLEYKTGAPQI